MRLLILILVLALCSTAAADSLTAREHYEKGLSAYALGRFDDAAREYEAAFDLKPDPALLYNAAQAHRLAGNKSRALFLYENYLRLFPDRPNEKEVRRHIAALKTAIESDSRAKSSPPVEPMVSPPNPEAVSSPAPAPAPVVTSPAAETAAAPAPKKPRWVWGVVGGVAGVVVVGLAVGLGVGLSGTDYPHATPVTLK